MEDAEGASGFYFMYEPAPTFVSIAPSMGTTRGNTRVRMLCTGLLNGPATVRFGSEATARKTAAHIADNVLEFSTPVLPVGSVDLFFSRNGMDWIDTDLTFLVHVGPAIASLDPPLGSVHGGTVVSVQGLNLFSSELWYCAIDDAVAVRGTYVSENTIECTMPSMPPESSTTRLSVYLMPATTAARLDLTPSVLEYATRCAGELRFDFVQPSRLVAVTPTLVFNTGGTLVTLDVEEATTTRSATLECLWQQNTADGGTEQSTAAVLSSDHTAYLCATPPLMHGSASNVTVTYNGRLEASASFLQVLTVAQPTIVSSFPTRSVVDYNSSLTLHGADFYMHGTETQCIFTADGPEDIISVATAQVPTSEMVTCSVPPAVTMAREVQSITVSGAEPTAEVQTVEVAALPTQPEVQRIATEDWGIVHESW
jgi:hypothetical protein